MVATLLPKYTRILFPLLVHRSSTLSSSSAGPNRNAQVQFPRTMGDNIKQADSAGAMLPFSATASRSCPCCSFLSHSTFLPTGVTTLEKDRSKIEQKTRSGNLGNDSDNDGDPYAIVSPIEALDQIAGVCSSEGTVPVSGANSEVKQRVVLVDTHGHPHLNRERLDVYVRHNSNDGKSDDDPTAPPPSLISLTCSVSESDWDAALAYASKSDATLPALGVHPWYLSDLSDSWLSDLERLLTVHPSAIVGEIGLCKMARFVRTYPEGKAAALGLQRTVFKRQMELAAKLRRPVSVHCVKQHGVFVAVLKEIKEEAKVRAKQRKQLAWESGDAASFDVDKYVVSAFPPAVGMHSFTGTAHHVKELLAFETALFASKVDDDDERPPMFFFGFSHSVNVAMCSSIKSKRQGWEAIRAVPASRLLAESDVHSPKDVAAGTAGAIANIAAALDMPLLDVAGLVASNGLTFFDSLGR